MPATKLELSFDFPRQLIRSVALEATSGAHDITLLLMARMRARGSGRAT